MISVYGININLQRVCEQADKGILFLTAQLMSVLFSKDESHGLVVLQFK